MSIASRTWVIDLMNKIQSGITPIGTVISYMGTTAPTNYLSCDGSTYNIADYTKFAEFIKAQFGSYNYFGGDGTTTFAVPDLRGEFLRGSGSNSHSNEGNGADVGAHQGSTAVPNLAINGPSGSYMIQNWTSDTYSITNADCVYGNKSSHWSNFAPKDAGTSSGSGYPCVKIRPTNTSVLYCIKYR